MIDLSKATEVINKHIQIHDNSCSASGYEILLKIAGLIPEHDYRYQANPKNSGIGFDTIKQYRDSRVTVDFNGKKEVPQKAFAEIRTELSQDRACLISVHNFLIYDVWDKSFKVGGAHIWTCVTDLKGRVCALTKTDGTNTSSLTDIESLLTSVHDTFNFYKIDYVTYTITRV